MKKIFRNITAATLVITGLFAGKTSAQQPTTQDKSLLWEISGNGLAKPSYLYGTIHMICENDFKVTEKTKQALSKSAQLVIEANILDPNINTIMAKAMASDVPLSKKLSPADYHDVDSILKKKCGVPLAPFENYQLAATISLLAMKSFPCQELKSYETTFIQTMQADKKHIGYLEGLEEQVGYLLKSYTDKQIVEQVKAFDSTSMNINQLVAAYKAEDLAGMYNLMTTPDQMDENTIHWMLEVRNKNWIDKMPVMMQQESTFFAVGGAHIAGPVGLIKLLREKGYTVTPILN
ncbi:TraB/GumN family protein [Chitinophaga sp. CC14]|uniref:TraB/GumN family protein n=1 Tax=Chitinophaga sp. CC14 TaxID=3029199 RepID=UPI003B7BEADC